MGKECINANSVARAILYRKVDQIPEFVKKQLIERHNKYVRTRADIDAHQGLISPIRAIVFNNKQNNITSVANIISKLITPTGKLSTNGLSCEVVEEVFMHYSKIIGYCVAMKNEELNDYNLGISYCRPSDYKYFDKEKGILLAYNHALETNSCVNTNPVGPEGALFTSDKYKYTCYLFLKSFAQQVDEFTWRCDKYYKTNLPKETKA